jgi:hypothetical protein
MPATTACDRNAHLHVAAAVVDSGKEITAIKRLRLRLVEMIDTPADWDAGNGSPYALIAARQVFER